MPRETICSRPDSYKVAVGWSREAEYVQLASGAETDCRDGKHADLDRAAINKLIVILRRARDQAFGADA